MLFDLNGNKFMVKFSRLAVHTFAELWQEKSDLRFDCLNIVGIAECSKKDIFQKSKGRKVALKKLFDEMNTFAIEDDRLNYLNNNKEDRTRIWEIYFKEHKK